MTQRDSYASERNAKLFVTRHIVYEAERELKIYELPEATSVDEAIRRFEAEFKLRKDPETGVWRRIESSPEKGASDE